MRTQSNVINALNTRVALIIKNVTKKEKETSIARQKEKKEIISKLTASSNELSDFFKKMHMQGNPLFSKVKIKDFLFRLFMANYWRVGRYFVLPCMSIDKNTNKVFDSTGEDEKSEKTNEHSIVFAWDIFTTEVKLMYMQFYHGGRPYQASASNDDNFHVSLYESFISKDEIRDLKDLSVEELRKEKVNENHSEFVKLLKESLPTNPEKFIEYITDKHVTELAKKGDPGFTFSKRSRKPLVLPEDDRYLRGEGKTIEQNLWSADDRLLNEGYPDIQKVWVVVDKGAEDVADKLVTARTIRLWYKKDYYQAYSKELHDHYVVANDPWYKPYTPGPGD